MLNNDEKYKNPPPLHDILAQKAKEAIHFDPDKKLPFQIIPIILPC